MQSSDIRLTRKGVISSPKRCPAHHLSNCVESERFPRPRALTCINPSPATSRLFGAGCRALNRMCSRYPAPDRARQQRARLDRKIPGHQQRPDREHDIARKPHPLPEQSGVVERHAAGVGETVLVHGRELRPADLNGSAGLFRLKEELTRRVNLAVSPNEVSAVLFKEVVVQ